MANNLTEEETQRLRDLVSQGLTASEVAKQIGRNAGTVREAAKRMGLNLKPGKAGNPFLALARGRPSAFLDKAPPGLSLAQRQARAKLPTVTITLDAGAFQILTAAADHRHKSVERLAADLIEGTCFLGSIATQEAKALRYRTISEKEKISAQNSANDSRNRDIACEAAKAAEV
jgi:hypothetical protein